MKAQLPDLSHLGLPGTVIELRVTPNASANRITLDMDRIRVAVTAVPEGGRANAAVVKLLAKAIGVAPSRLVLLRGETAREKQFRVIA